MTAIDRRIWWVVGLVILVLVLWLLVDHLLFPTLPVPAGAPPVAR